MSSRAPRLRSEEGRSARTELLALHRRIWQENKRRIEASSYDDTGELKRYRGAYTRACSDYEEVSTFGKMASAAARADCVYVGDYHTSKQSQKVFLKVLKRLVDAERRPIVALELFQSTHQPAIDKYLAGAMPEGAFLNAVKFHRNWPFDNWGNFKPILDLAREAGLKVIGIDARIDGADSLRKRDEHAAAVIARWREDLGLPVAVLIGDLHIAPSHLPREVDRALAKRGLAPAKPLLVYQNSERIYWKLAEKALEKSVEVVRVDPRSFCVMNTPPIILQQTYLNWLERDEDVLDYSDARAEFLTLLRRIADFLEIDLPPDADEVEVYTCGDLSFLHRLRADRVFDEDEIREIKRQIRSAESYFIPRSKLVYLANLSTNHAAEEASHYLKILCAPEELPRERSAAFYANALHEAIGFFGSKIINDRRKTPHEREFRGLLESDEFGPLERRVAKLVLDHKALERGKLDESPSRIWKQPVDVFIGVTHALGYMLGEKLFYAMVDGKIGKELCRELYFDPFTAPGRARTRYFELVERLENVRIPERT